MLRRPGDLSLRAKLLGSFALVLTVLVLLTSAAYRTTTANQQAADAVSHSLLVIGTAHETLTSLVDMETGYRGFLLTGRDEFLEPYLAGQQTADENLAELERLTADDPEQAARWHELAGRVLDWRTSVAEPAIALRRQVSSDQRNQGEIEALVASGVGKRRFDAMRQTVNEAIASEETLLNARQQASAEARNRLLLVLMVGTVGAVGLALVLATLLTTNIAGAMAR